MARYFTSEEANREKVKAKNSAKSTAKQASESEAIRLSERLGEDWLLNQMFPMWSPKDRLMKGLLTTTNAKK